MAEKNKQTAHVNLTASSSEQEQYEFISPAIRLLPFHVLQLSGQLVEPRHLHLGKYWLPQRAFTEGPIRLTSRPEILQLLFSCLDQYALGCALSKTLPGQIIGRFYTLLKVIEYGWSNSCYTMSDWQPAHFKKLAEEVGRKGWPAALKIEERIRSLPTAQSDLHQTRAELMVAIGSNVQHGDFTRLPIIRSLAYAKEGFSWAVGAPVFKPLVVSSLVPVLESMNQLCELSGLNLPFERPHPSAIDVVGQNRQSTLSMPPDTFAELMTVTVDYALRVGPLLLRVFHDLLIWRKSQTPSLEITQQAWEAAFNRIPSRLLLEKALKADVGLTSTKGGRIGIYSIVTAFHAASFLPLAFLNGRRKDEVIHPEIGLQQDCLYEVNRGLKLFMVPFYIEKSLKERVTMLVNPLTQDLIRQLDALAKITLRFEDDHVFAVTSKPHMKNSLFVIPDFRSQHGSGNRIRYFQYLNANTGAWDYVRNVIGSISEELTPRMMRRGYALHHHYKYENSTLSALRQKLGHRGLGEVRSYVLDRGTTKMLGQALYGPLTVSQLASSRRDATLMQDAIDEVGGEKLVALISRVMKDDEFLVGGFPKLIRRYVQVLKSDVSYRELDEARLANAVAISLQRKGHKPHPKPDGNCWRGSSTSKHRGACQDRHDVEANFERATPAVCNDCHYNEARKQHTENLKADAYEAENDLRTMPQGTLDSLKLLSAVQSLRKVIEIRAMREARFEGMH